MSTPSDGACGRGGWGHPVQPAALAQHEPLRVAEPGQHLADLRGIARATPVLLDPSTQPGHEVEALTRAQMAVCDITDDREILQDELVGTLLHEVILPHRTRFVPG